MTWARDGSWSMWISKMMFFLLAMILGSESLNSSLTFLYSSRLLSRSGYIANILNQQLFNLMCD